jgi:O-antigen ligase
MALTIGKLIQLIAALAGALGFFLLAYRLPEKRVLWLLVALIPIQIIDSKFGTFNTFLTFVVAFAFILQGRIKAAPLFWSVFLLFLAYAISFSFTHPDARIWHVLYMTGFAANFLLFYMVYNFIMRTSDWESIFTALFAANVLVVVACLIEIALGDRQLVLLGIKDWTLGSTRGDIGRVTGPFGSTHTTADYLVAQCMLIAYWLVHKFATGRRRWLTLLLGLNFVCLVSTGDRGGFLSFLIGGLLFVILFRREIGGFGILKYATVGSLLFAMASLAVVQFTEFDRLFQRLGDTQITVEDHPRKIGFRRGVQWFQESPIIGSGPRLDISSRDVQIGEIKYRGAHPHNLYLTILVTTGVVGFIAWTAFFISAMAPMVRVVHNQIGDDLFLSNLPKLGLLIVFLFLIGEVRIEFLRSNYLDYQNYIFVLLAMFVACSHIILRRSGLVFQSYSVHRPSSRFAQPANARRALNKNLRA